MSKFQGQVASNVRFKRRVLNSPSDDACLSGSSRPLMHNSLAEKNMISPCPVALQPDHIFPVPSDDMDGWAPIKPQPVFESPATHEMGDGWLWDACPNMTLKMPRTTNGGERGCAKRANQRLNGKRSFGGDALGPARCSAACCCMTVAGPPAGRGRGCEKKPGSPIHQ